MSDYRYLFPFEKIPPKSRVLIYGAGILGQEYLKQIRVSNYCTVVGFIDKNYENYPQMYVKVFPPETILNLSFDYVVLAIRTENWLSEIERVLISYGVSKERIVYVLERKTIPTNIIDNKCKINCSLAYETSSVSVAVFMSGGIGDTVIQKRFIVELISLVPEIRIDIFVVQNLPFPKWLYSDCVQVKNVLLDLGFRYNEYKEKYGLAISIYGSSFLNVDIFQPECFGENLDFVNRITLLQNQCNRSNELLSTPDGISFYRHIYQGEDCYSWYNHGEVFEIREKKVSIPLPETPEPDISRLIALSYITVNTGNGSCKDGKKIAKTWPISRFEETISIFKKYYPHIQVVQVGTLGEERISNVDFCLFGQRYDRLALVLKHSIFHLDIEGGLVHLATQLGTKCIVLWGPTVYEYFSYESNTNIMMGTCHGCAGLYRDINKCARNMEEPECMYTITPEVVMHEIERAIVCKSSCCD